MKQPLISLILPVYGVEDYLEECIPGLRLFLKLPSQI